MDLDELRGEMELRLSQRLADTGLKLDVERLFPGTPAMETPATAPIVTAAERLTGQRVERLRRRSKYILADLASGETLLIHLGMSGTGLSARIRTVGPGVMPP